MTRSDHRSLGRNTHLAVLRRSAIPGPGIGLPTGRKSTILVFGPVILGLVQGLTEFLPVSSSGHLVLAERLLGMARPGLSLEVALHLGTLVAVLVVYRRDLGSWRLWSRLAWAMLPAALLGPPLRGTIDALFGSLRATGCGWLATAALLVWAASRCRGRRRLTDLRPAEAVWIGCLQVLAFVPGVSRSGAVLAAGLACGLDAVEAARFSFLLSIPSVGGAALLALPGTVLAGTGVMGLWLGAGTAAVAGVLGIRWFVARLDRRRMVCCAAYCAALAAIALASGA